jgi:hypothetical protein
VRHHTGGAQAGAPARQHGKTERADDRRGIGDAHAQHAEQDQQAAADEAESQNRVRLVADNSAKAKETLTGLNLQVSEAEVIGIVLKNKPGTLAVAARRLASAEININYSYSGAEEGSKRQLVVFGLSDVKRAAKALKKA